MYNRIVKIFLRLALSTAFLSAVADRFGLYPSEMSAWGNWKSFLEYTSLINPWFPPSITSGLATIATVAEIILGLFLLLGLKTELMAKLSGYLLLLFALSMTFSLGFKTAFDYSVFSASAAAFSLSMIKEKFCELDALIARNER